MLHGILSPISPNTPNLYVQDLLTTSHIQGHNLPAPEVGIPDKYYEKTGSERTSNYYLGDRLVAVKKGSALEYIHQDHLGSSSVSSNSTTGGDVV